MTRAFCSFSGGKDSCLALWTARQQGYDVRTLLVMMNESGDRSRSHGIPRHLLQRQADALGAEAIFGVASWKDYEPQFTALLHQLKQEGHEAGIFGDIDLLPHREWEEKVCAAAGLRAHLPLWQRNRDELAREITRLGFKAIVACVDSRHLDDSFAGRFYDAQFLADLPPGVDACGENGEFHTFVFDGPGFRAPVEFSVVAREPYVSPLGNVRYCFARLE
jgi:uncharacterized protein (TIGR00290 family)